MTPSSRNYGALMVFYVGCFGYMFDIHAPGTKETPRHGILLRASLLAFAVGSLLSGTTDVCYTVDGREVEISYDSFRSIFILAGPFILCSFYRTLNLAPYLIVGLSRCLICVLVIIAIYSALIAFPFIEHSLIMAAAYGTGLTLILLVIRFHR